MDTKTILDSLPHLPGVYLFKGPEGDLLYVGKAKDIKKRVATYFNKNDQSDKTRELVDTFATLDHIVTRSDLEALLLEASLIQTFQPPFNILLKEGNPFLYLFFSSPKKGLPTIEIVRNKDAKRAGRYLGPFLNKGDARKMYDYLIRTFRLYLCGKKMLYGCLDYHIGRCAGSCLNEFDEVSYKMRLELAYQLMTGNFKKFSKEIEQLIETFNSQKEFERSRELYESLQHAEHLFNVISTHFSVKRYQPEIEAKIVAPPEYIKDKTPYTQKAEELQQLLDLESPPKTIDCFDISHFQSRGLVGSCVRFNEGLPDKKAFRHFNIKTINQQNDYAALQEIVQRRYKSEADKPDLILIDGGKGQLSAVLPFVGSTPCVSLAKKEERIFTAKNHEGILLNLHSPAGRLLIALRDYAHHFAITFHRTKNRIFNG